MFSAQIQDLPGKPTENTPSNGVDLTIASVSELLRLRQHLDELLPVKRLADINMEEELAVEAELPIPIKRSSRQ